MCSFPRYNGLVSRCVGGQMPNLPPPPVNATQGVCRDVPASRVPSGGLLNAFPCLTFSMLMNLGTNFFQIVLHSILPPPLRRAFILLLS